jgi:hypothetical protein
VVDGSGRARNRTFTLGRVCELPKPSEKVLVRRSLPSTKPYQQVEVSGAAEMEMRPRRNHMTGRRYQFGRFPVMGKRHSGDTAGHDGIYRTVTTQSDNGSLQKASSNNHESRAAPAERARNREANISLQEIPVRIHGTAAI